MSLDIFNFLQKKQHVRINKIDDSLKIKFRFFYFLSHCPTWYSVQYGSGLPYTGLSLPAVVLMCNVHTDECRT